jgi:hypothetical protein
MVLSGSAHSRFERHLQPGLNGWVVDIQPFPRNLFDVIVQPGQVFALPFASSKAGDLDLLAEATGCNPRAMYWLQ